MNDLKLWKFISEKLKNGKKIILTSVLESKGSSPGKAGFKIAVAEDKTMFGTIGGGQMEYDLIAESYSYLKSRKKIQIRKQLFHSKKVRKLQSGLVCQGNQTNFSCSLDKKDLKLVDAIVNSFENFEPSILKLSNTGIKVLANTKNESHIRYQYNSDKNWQYEENIGVQNTIYIIGGGHVGLALSRQMELLGFRVIVYDDRADVQTIKENYSADEIIISNYENVGDCIKEGEYSFVAIVTSALPTDKIALKKIVNKKFKYIGLMGSKAKLKRIFDELKSEGIKTAHLRKVNAPIGLEIYSESVQEIAVSIAAEIIKLKNKV